jgi:hypothetical protein
MRPISRSRCTGTSRAWCCIRSFETATCRRGFEPVRVLRESLQALPKGVEKVCLRTDTAGYDHRLLQFCAGGHSRFGVIEFAIGVDVTLAFKAAVAEVSEWQPLSREVEGRREPTGQEWAEVCFVPSWAATKSRTGRSIASSRSSRALGASRTARGGAGPITVSNDVV